MNIKELQTTLETHPAEGEILFNPKTNWPYLPIDIVRIILDSIVTLSVSGYWSHSNFRDHYFKSFNEERCSASIEVELCFEVYGHGELGTIFYKRKLVGAVTFILSDYGQNENYAATAKSLCIVNALSQEYIRFGRNFNKVDDVFEMEKPLKLKPTIIEEQKYKNAIKNNDYLLAESYFNGYELPPHNLSLLPSI